MLFRKLKRKTTIEDANSAHFVDVELRNDAGWIDARLSAYQVDKESLTRVATERCAGLNLGPETTCWLDLTHKGACVEATSDDTGFAFTDAAHREILLDTDLSVRRLIDQVVPELAQRGITLPKSSMKEYVKGRKNENDPEWSAYFSDRCTRSEWRDWWNKA